MNPVDITFAVLLLLALLRGYAKGLLGTAAGYVAPVAAFLTASEWSDPVRDRLLVAMPAAPEFVLDILAPFLVFVVVVGAVRIAAALLSRSLGVGLSLPARLAAGAVSATVTATVLGSIVLALHQMRPQEPPTIRNAGDLILRPLEMVIVDVDDRCSASILAPLLARMASVVVTEAIAHKDEIPLPGREQVEDAVRKAATAAAAASLPPSALSPRGNGK